MKKDVQSVHSAPSQHWVGDGFPVRSLFSYGNHGSALSPFLLLDYAGPMEFAPSSDRPRGVGVHPHRGFETVTIVYSGEVAHRDSTGAGGVIGPGDVQWMSAASGILHEEFHSQAFTARGGTLEMVQLWVNLPAKDKMSAPGYQALLSKDIPQIDLPGGAGQMRIIAGDYAGTPGPARTFTPMQVWDLRLSAGAHTTLPATPGHSLVLVLLRGSVRVGAALLDQPGQHAIMATEGDTVDLQAEADSLLLWLSGAPIDESVAGYGPFVMNTRAEIEQAMADMRSGQFGRWRAAASA